MLSDLTSSVTKSFHLQNKVERFCLFLAPLLFAISSFFWQNGEYGVESATLIVLSMFLWIPALVGLFSILKTEMPRYSIWGLWTAVFGCVSGICFAFLGYLSTILGIPHGQYLKALANYPFSSQLLLFASGPLFPLSLFVLGIFFLAKRRVHPFVAILFCIGALTFPFGRVFRMEMMAHIADGFLLAACWSIAAKLEYRI